MSQRRSIDDIWINIAGCFEMFEGGVGSQELGQALADLGDLEAVGKSVVEQLRLIDGYDLSDATQASKGRAVQDAVGVPLPAGAPGLIGGRTMQSPLAVAAQTLVQLG